MLNKPDRIEDGQLLRCGSNDISKRIYEQDRVNLDDTRNINNDLLDCSIPEVQFEIIH